MLLIDGFYNGWSGFLPVDDDGYEHPLIHSLLWS